ncbi:UDP-N-acetylmuramoyl-L-alanyl-D-glutamate--2,6-diaminopimelate ligase [uncultured Tateyamaria sp.]|uniref:UDP-N-acetylmuramoyl-L-alanyl-D-glutamate--2, 6-diaminopimelate ligase n=1 Tax=uncultured Tateyamaria sp. TaxID=455651 RepID=UPI002635C769|nr:UDP-N-acetylmuramoyl-L-alanyl-D-glutamate--2,6-diaminopimelate ligase [uncultured Tateyamaria sp.]
MIKRLADLDLLAGSMVLGPALLPDSVVTGLTVDSRKVRPGYVFFAAKGAKLDGARFIQYAARQQALAAVCTLEGAVTALETGAAPLPLIIVEDPRLALARAASRFTGNQPETVVAITGTSGKTSTADFLRQIWELTGEKAASFGTTGVKAPGLDLPGGLTTPDPVGLHKLLATLANHGATCAAMEASSHGLDQRRLDGVKVAASALTNVARDHLDYHPTSAHYAAAKLRLFSDLTPIGAPVVVNADDDMFPLIARIAAARGLRLIPVGENADAASGIRLGGTVFDNAGQTVAIGWDGAHQVRLPLIGAFQARNVLTAAALAVACGADQERVLAVLPSLQGVKGRMELVARRANGAAIYVDYAHKPDAMVAALRGIRPHVAQRLHIVFGAGGDRDPGKRTLMGAAAAEHADVVYVTDDNPRSEDPAVIRKAILEAAPEAVEVADRAEAILRAADGLEEGDVLLIAGKGHETGQIVDGDVLPFDDAEHARAAVVVLDADEEDILNMLKGDT